MNEKSPSAATICHAAEASSDDRPLVLSVGFALKAGSEATAELNAFRSEVAHSQAQAVAMMFELQPAVVLIDLGLTDGSPLAVADFVSFRHPDARVIFVSDTAMFSDGSLFQHCSNVRAHVPRGMAEPDMVALVAHHATADTQRR
ncbi:hypothetical protein [Jannaschia formosa]|uniref:hypothetical protein n=1 Tax=Jannaschia formosa TaxID=2259592 RepID=UPI000E1BF96A|nr:hypothetical protein [Jannaschia formosa]TFL19109.1 hypothetical protein DR046_06765 [Jannaschia formosa]